MVLRRGDLKKGEGHLDLLMGKGWGGLGSRL